MPDNLLPSNTKIIINVEVHYRTNNACEKDWTWMGNFMVHDPYTLVLIFNFECRCVNFHKEKLGAGKTYKTPLLN